MYFVIIKILYRVLENTDNKSYNTTDSRILFINYNSFKFIFTHKQVNIDTINNLK